MQKLVNELKIDLVNDKDRNGRFSVQILLSSKSVKRQGLIDFSIEKLHEKLKEYNGYEITLEEFKQKIDS